MNSNSKERYFLIEISFLLADETMPTVERLGVA